MASSAWTKHREEATQSSTVPAGSYDVRVKKAKWKKAGTGKHGLNIQYEIVNGPHAGEPLWDNVWFSPDNPGAQRFFFGNLAALGADAAFFDSMPVGPEEPQRAMELIAEHIIGAYATVTVEVGSYNNMPTNNVTGYTTYSGPAAAVTSSPIEAQVTATREQAAPERNSSPAGIGGAKPPF